ncbi:hypothetical protein PSPO01_09739 [Paraphaeosphaeria sporulosa]
MSRTEFWALKTSQVPVQWTATKAYLRHLQKLSALDMDLSEGVAGILERPIRRRMVSYLAAFVKPFRNCAIWDWFEEISSKLLDLGYETPARASVDMVPSLSLRTYNRLASQSIVIAKISELQCLLQNAWSAFSRVAGSTTANACSSTIARARPNLPPAWLEIVAGRKAIPKTVVSASQRSQIDTIKNPGSELYAPEKGGSFEAFNQRPLNPVIERY